MPSIARNRRARKGVVQISVFRYTGGTLYVVAHPSSLRGTGIAPVSPTIPIRPGRPTLKPTGVSLPLPAAHSRVMLDCVATTGSKISFPVSRA
jgi:hypothetical protein